MTGNVKIVRKCQGGFLRFEHTQFTLNLHLIYFFNLNLKEKAHVTQQLSSGPEAGRGF